MRWCGTYINEMVWEGGSEPLVLPTRWDLIGVSLWQVVCVAVRCGGRRKAYVCYLRVGVGGINPMVLSAPWGKIIEIITLHKEKKLQGINEMGLSVSRANS